MKRIKTDDRSEYYVIPLLNRKFLSIFSLLPEDIISKLFGKRVVIFEYEDEVKVNVKFRGFFEAGDGVTEEVAIVEFMKALDKCGIVPFVSSLDAISSLPVGDDIFKEVSGKVVVESSDCELKEENVEEYMEKWKELNEWFNENKESFPFDLKKLFMAHLRRVK